MMSEFSQWGITGRRYWWTTTEDRCRP